MIHETRSPTMTDLGIAVEHDQACAVYFEPDNIKPAVYCCNTGVFQPSWQAQNEGWKLVKAKNFFQRWLLHTFFE